MTGGWGMRYMYVFTVSEVYPFLLQIATMTCDVKQLEGGKLELLLKLNFEDKMQRELCSELKEGTCISRVITTET